MSSEPRDRDDARQSDLAVMDANEYKQKRRLENILDALDNVEETANRAWEQLVAGKISWDAKNILVQRAVQQAIRETYNLLYDHHESTEDDEDDAYWAGRESDPIGVIPRDREDPVPVSGLRDFMALPEYVTEEWTETVSRRNAPPAKEVQSREHTVPEQVSYEAFLTLKEFLNVEHDLEITFEELEDTTPAFGFSEVQESDIDAAEVDVEVLR